MGHDRPCANDAAVADCYPRKDERIFTNETIPAYPGMGAEIPGHVMAQNPRIECDIGIGADVNALRMREVEFHREGHLDRRINVGLLAPPQPEARYGDQRLP